MKEDEDTIQVKAKSDKALWGDRQHHVVLGVVLVALPVFSEYICTPGFQSYQD